MATLEDLIAKLTLDNAPFTKSIEDSINKTSGLEKAFKQVQFAGKMMTGAVVGLAGAVVGAVTAAGGLATKLAIDAAPIIDVKNAFDGLTSSAGISGDAMLESLQKGSLGMISTGDLMKSFNKASSLVSLQFAQELPDAMKYLSKVSAATGQDMGYMLDSIVTGVGRMSPMILDNLGIQIDLEAATQAWADANGRTVESMTKTERQTALFNQVMEKLAFNTDAMPDITESAAVKWAQFKARISDTKTEIGIKFIPILEKVLDVFGGLADKILPKVMTVIDQVVPFFERIADVAGRLITAFLDAGLQSTEFKEALSMILPQEVIDGIYSFVDGIKQFIEKAKEVLEPITTWVAQNVQLKDVLIGVGLVIATFVIPALWSLLAPILSVVAIVALVIGIVALLRMAWENDFLGIATFFTDLWNNTLLPAFEQLKVWLGENVPIAIQKLSDFWTNTLQPALQTVWEFLQNNVLPIFQTLVDFWLNSVQTALQQLSDMWTNVLQPALQIVWDFLNAHVIPLFTALGELLGLTVLVAVQALSDLWTNTLQPALEAVWDFISAKLQPILEWLSDKLGIDLTDSTKVVSGIMDGFKAALEGVGGWLDKVTEAVRKLIDWLKKLVLPADLQPGSPTPFEWGLRGIADILNELNRVQLPTFKSNLELKPEVLPGFEAMANFENNNEPKGIVIENINNYMSGGWDAVQYSIDRAKASVV